MQPLTFCGRVEIGEGIASGLGCPTANIAIEEGLIIPALGVYLGETNYDGKKYPSLVCINDGRTGHNLKMEVHLLGENKELAGKHLRVEIFKKLRDLIPYPGKEIMETMVAKDMQDANKWFASDVK
jgi:riboflavin kinase/FMN adenylyltransferase